MVFKTNFQSKSLNQSLFHRYPAENNYKYKMTSKLKTSFPPPNTLMKPKTVLFYKNGDRNFRGYHISVTERRFNSFQNLLSELTRITNLTQGVRYVFTPTTGTRIESLDELADGQSYVCGSHPKLKKINYQHAPDGSDRKKVQKHFIPVPPMKMYAEKDSLHFSPRPRVITVIRNNLSLVRQKRCIKILLNKRTAQTFDQVLNDITSSVGIEGVTGVRKLFNLDGKLVLSLSELFGEEDIFIAVGSEKFQQSDLQAILQSFGIDRSKKKVEINDIYIPSVIESPSSGKNNLKSKKKRSLNKLILTNSKIGGSLNVNPSNAEVFKVSKLPDIKKEIPAKFELLNSTPKNPTQNSIKNPLIDYKNVQENVILDSDDFTHKVHSIKKEEKEEVYLESSFDNHNEAFLSFDDQKSISNSKNNSVENLYVSEVDDEKPSIKEDNEKERINIGSQMSSNEQNKNDNFEFEKSSFVIADYKDIELYFDLGKQLGDGNFAVVKEAIDKKTNIKYAIKIIDVLKLKDRHEMLDNEITIQRTSSHPNIVTLFSDFRSPTTIFLIMELVTGGDLFDLISENVCFEEHEAALFTRDLCSGLSYLHRRDIVHRDIKPENLMVMVSPTGKQILKIADFGLAMKVEHPIYTICGTPTYVAPEILSEKGYGLQVDIWAAGVIIYIMLCGFPPFRSESKKQTELFDLIEKGEFEFPTPYWSDVSEISKDLISKVLVVDVKNRYSALEILSHTWVTQYGLMRNATQ
ncbi:serine/threonine-protein kinase DCLK2 [Hydra vulgaris]|uniref:non-specific serine/threonine protein kinase n=1 Tax=Hydra vulgaris TaxID=6087 RepID=A0ABM4CXJ0_HYDVU